MKDLIMGLEQMAERSGLMNTTTSSRLWVKRRKYMAKIKAIRMLQGVCISFVDPICHIYHQLE